MNIKVENASKIRELAKDVVRMSNVDHPMLNSTYENLVNTGIKDPYYTQMAIKTAEYDSYIKASKDFACNEISGEEYINRFKNTRKKLSMLDKSTNGKKLYDSMKEKYLIYANDPTKQDLYKKGKDYMLKRIAILSGMSEGSEKLVPCKVNKGVKKWVYRFFKLVNR